MKRIMYIITALFFASCSSDNDTSPSKTDDEYMVGVQYFYGWWEDGESLTDTTSKWVNREDDWRDDFPERIPTNGMNNSQTTMDNDIQSAADGGVDYFVILYYLNKMPGLESKYLTGSTEINKAINHFFASPKSRKIKFMLDFCNSNDYYGLGYEENVELMLDLMKTAMFHPSYLKIDGRPVVKIHGPGQFLSQVGGDGTNDEKIQRCNEFLDMMREEMRDAGIGEITIALGITTAITSFNDSIYTTFKQLNVDFTSQYAGAYSLTDGDGSPDTKLEYEMLDDHCKTLRDYRTDDLIPNLPHLEVGWDGEPWGYYLHDPAKSAYKMPTEEQWRTALLRMKDDLDANANFGFPRQDGTCQKSFTIYAWNEYGEGGFLAPTVGWDNMKLDVLKEVFPN